MKHAFLITEFPLITIIYYIDVFFSAENELYPDPVP